MTTPICEDGGPLREWAPLAALLQQIPAKLQNGIFTHDINFTCIDAIPEFIAIGSNHGIIYWFNREKQDLQRLRCENINARITCVQVISTVDYMVAAGNEQGIVTVFQIPKNPPDSLPDSLKPKQKKQVERYSISGLHKSAVTAVEWSKNGMKLFSGDQNGLVVLTEIDFYMHLSKSSELLNEKYSVVQLSYQQGLLLVSTTLRTILVNRNENGKVTQVGQKERKILGKLGAVFGSRHNYVQDQIIYASRPGLRLWQADKTGTVLKTLIFKDAVWSGHPEVELLNPAPESCKKNRGEPTFGIVLPFCDDLLVTYGDDIIYVVNPQTIAITSVVTDLRHITDVACTKDEIFILEGERNIIRLAYFPDTNNFTSETKNTLESFAALADISKPVTTGIMELTSKLKESSIVPAIPFHKMHPSNIIQSVGIVPNVIIDVDTNTIVNAEEAVEVPPIVPININTPLITDTNNIPEHSNTLQRNNLGQDERNHRRQIFQKISQQEFEDVVFTPEKKAKKSRNKVDGIENKSITSDDERMNISKQETNANELPNTNETINDNETNTTHSSTLTLNDFILKSERNIETIQRDVENKEKLLVDVLDFDLSKYMTSSRTSNKENNTNTSDTIDMISLGQDIDSSISLIALNYSKDDELKELNDQEKTDSEEDEDVSYRTELKKLEDLGECRKKLLQNKSNGSSVVSNNYVDVKKISHTTEAHDLEAQFNILSRESVTSAMLEEEGWVLIKNDIT